MGSSAYKREQRAICDSDGLKDWMTSLRDDIRTNVPIIYLAIPGSHDSMTFGISRKSKLAPDAEDIVRKIHRLLPWFIPRWAKTQQLTVTDQLNSGIRFFDLRISKMDGVTEVSSTPCPEIGVYYFVHGLYSGQVESAIVEINYFLDQHPGELVILDFQHFYAIGNADHYLLYRFMKTIFGDKIFTPQDGKLTELTLNRAYKEGKQVIIVYRSPFFVPEYWPGYMWPTPWPQTASMSNLQKFLKSTLENRCREYGWVSQCVLTPDAKYIAKRPFSKLENTAKQVIKHLEKWINEQTPGIWQDNEEKRVNVIIADFVNLKNSQFAATVVNLNNKIPKTDKLVGQQDNEVDACVCEELGL